MSLADYDIVIGLEVHAQLLTRSKLFSGASTAFGAEPNTHTRPLCLGLPGVLPVVNAQAVELAMRAGLALECRVNEKSEWSRKHYFYPDLPKGYQVTQYEFPICEWGQLKLGPEFSERAIRIRRIHLEEDAGKLIHAGRVSLVDLNRAGTPLIEIVSEPDLTSSAEAVDYLKRLRELLVFLGVNDGNMEEGSFRCDANVSVKKKGTPTLGTRCELKNLNSFRFIQRAIEVEAARHVELLEGGGRIEQETRLFDPDRGETRAMRSKEDAHDYRYFPEPDLPLLRLEGAHIAQVKAALPELPEARRQRYVRALGLPAYDAEVLTGSRAMSELFDRCVALGLEAKKVSNWFMGELSRLLNEHQTTADQVRFTPAQFKELLAAVDGNVISANAAKEVFAELFATGQSPVDIIAAKGLAQVSDTGAIEAVIDEVMAANPKNVESWRAGRSQILGFFVGQVMKAMKGKGNPKLINELLTKKLGPQTPA
jgi:aspartyl-tRNA(Asn)/glutamyl-tRNA(Gln) amidotransferase subunit B